MLETSPSFKSSWINSFPLFKSCYSSFSSACFDSWTNCGCSSTTSCYNSSFSTSLNTRTSCGCSSTTCCCNSPSSMGLDAETVCNCSSIASWGLISTSSSKYEITITYGTSFVIEVMILLRKFSVVFNSSSTPYFSIIAQKP